MGGWGMFHIWLQRFGMSVFSCDAWPWDDWELIQTPTAPVTGKIPLKSYLPFLPNPDNWIIRMQKMWRYLGKWWWKHRGESWQAAPWQRGRQSWALSLLRRVQCRKMFLECICDSSSQAHCPGASINTAVAKIPNELKQNKTCIHGSIATQGQALPVKMKVSHKLHLQFSRDFSLLLCFGSLRPLWYLSKAFPFAHLIFITVYGNGDSSPPKAAILRRGKASTVWLFRRGTLQSILTISLLYSYVPSPWIALAHSSANSELFLWKCPMSICEITMSGGRKNQIVYFHIKTLTFEQ